MKKTHYIYDKTVINHVHKHKDTITTQDTKIDNSTTKSPIDTNELGAFNFFDKKKNEWVLQYNYPGYYSTETGIMLTSADWYEEPQSVIATEPDENIKYPIWDNEDEKWVNDDERQIEEMKVELRDKNNKKYQKAISDTYKYKTADEYKIYFSNFVNALVSVGNSNINLYGKNKKSFEKLDLSKDERKDIEKCLEDKINEINDTFNSNNNSINSIDDINSDFTVEFDISTRMNYT